MLSFCFIFSKSRCFYHSKIHYRHQSNILNHRMYHWFNGCSFYVCFINDYRGLTNLFACLNIFRSRNTHLNPEPKGRGTCIKQCALALFLHKSICLIRYFCDSLYCMCFVKNKTVSSCFLLVDGMSFDNYVLIMKFPVSSLNKSIFTWLSDHAYEGKHATTSYVRVIISVNARLLHPGVQFYASYVCYDYISYISNPAINVHKQMPQHM
jgi:hypothetical protein